MCLNKAVSNCDIKRRPGPCKSAGRLGDKTNLAGIRGFGSLTCWVAAAIGVNEAYFSNTVPLGGMLKSLAPEWRN